MASAGSMRSRLDKIEAALRLQAEAPIMHFLNEGDDPDKVVDAMIAEGKIVPHERGRLHFFRWMTEAEENALKRQQDTLKSGGDDDRQHGEDKA